MLLPHVNSADLLDLHDDLVQDYFPDTHWQKGSQGVVVGAELPSTFSSTEGTLMLNHWADDTALTLDNTTNKIPLLNSNRTYPLPVLNIAKRGFYRFTEMETNQSGTIEAVSPSYLASFNRWMSRDLDCVDIAEGTELDWSLGGFEGKIAKAFQFLISDLIQRDIYPGLIDDDDASYVEALSYKSLELVYAARVTTPESFQAKQEEKYHRKYRMQIENITPYGGIIASYEWDRNG